MHHSLSGVSEVISFSHGQALDSNSSGKAWIGESQHRILLFVKDFETVSPIDLVPHFCKDRKTAFVYIRKLVKLGALKRVSRGVYRVVHEVVDRLLKLPVRDTRPKKNNSSSKNEAGVRQPNGTRSVVGGLAVGVVGASVGSVGFGGGRLCFAGLYLDNVRYWAFGKYFQLEREKLLRVGDLGVADSVSYAEVAYLVRNAFLDGAVVIYSNVEDFERLGSPTVRVEYRPPSGYVKRNGVASTLRLAKEELVKAFKALAVVLGNILPEKRLLELLKWVAGVWGLSHVCG